MKTKYLNGLAPFLILSVLFLGSCKKDKCIQTVTYKAYEPVYMSYDELRSSVKSEPAQPLKNPGKIYMKGNYIFVSEIDKGIHIINNSNPSAPQNVAFIKIPGNVDIAATGNTLYADSYIDLLALDITNPQNVTVLKRIENALPQRAFTGGYYADPTKGVAIEWKETTKTEEVNGDCGNNNIWNKGGMWMEGDMVVMNAGSNFVPNTFNANTPGVGGSMARFTISSNMLYVVDNENLRKFNISSPANPVSSGTSYIGRNIETIFPYNNHLFIGSTNGMFIYNVTNPDNPVYISTYIHGTACDPVVVDGDYAYVTLRSGTPCNTSLNQLEVVNIQNLANPTLSHTVQMTNPHGLGKDGSALFVCDGTAGLKVLDATNPTTIPSTPVMHVSSIQATDVIPFNNKLFMIGTDGFYQYDYSNLQNITLLSRIPVEK
jgi:hypothetical protein